VFSFSADADAAAVAAQHRVITVKTRPRCRRGDFRKWFCGRNDSANKRWETKLIMRLSTAISDIGIIKGRGHGQTFQVQVLIFRNKKIVVPDFVLSPSMATFEFK
jgi:hypothetical protein